MMVDRTALRRLHKERFPHLPLDCGQPEAGIVDSDEWRDWSRFETTPDQLRIEDYLDGFDLAGRTILHIGIGNSGLAERLASSAKAIVGTTVVPAELERAETLGLANYRALLHNKYSGDNDPVSGSFDFIVDNNPTTFCCCMTHFGAMLDFYASRLRDRGQIVTDRVGLGWTTDVPGADPRWGFTFADLAACAGLVGLTAYRIDADVIVLARREPERPSIPARMAQAVRQLVRRVSRKVGRLVGR